MHSWWHNERECIHPLPYFGLIKRDSEVHSWVSMNAAAARIFVNMCARQGEEEVWSFYLELFFIEVLPLLPLNLQGLNMVEEVGQDGLQGNFLSVLLLLHDLWPADARATKSPTRAFPHHIAGGDFLKQLPITAMRTRAEKWQKTNKTRTETALEWSSSSELPVRSRLWSRNLRRARVVEQLAAICTGTHPSTLLRAVRRNCAPSLHRSSALDLMDTKYHYKKKDTQNNLKWKWILDLV